MTPRQPRRLLAAAPLLAIALFAGGLSRNEVIALARAKFPAVMDRHEPARFLVMVFDSTVRYVWGFPVMGSVMIHVSADTIALADRLATETGGRAGRASGDGTRHSYVFMVPAYVRDAARALQRLPMNTGDGLIPTAPNSGESGIDGVLASSVVHVDRFALYPREDQPLQFDILAVHLSEVHADTGRPAHSMNHMPPAAVPRDTTPSSKKKKAHVMRLVMLPSPVPDVVRPYELNACFDVAPNGDATLMSWTRSLDVNYNSKVRKSLDAYRFSPATQNGIAVRDTVCVRSKTVDRPPGH